MNREMQEVKELTDKVCKEHRLVETHWHGEGPYHCLCGAEVKAVSEDALRWIFQFHCVSEGIACAQKEIERLLADEREKYTKLCEKCKHPMGVHDEKVTDTHCCWLCAEKARGMLAERERAREMCATAVEKIESGDDGWNYALVKAYTVIRQLDLTKDLAPSTEERGKK